ncbi:V-type ATP synthase subunit E [Clostridium lacusfryxellense]|uniref:V-type ATP synthase subunit E n=1 Tax=Clostridium lacusfryxellense TaxID=205328 RepID=UPI001C0D3496|nr:V-type ATP synthase subunit E [Clostridium lacusfryxellense]MBU3110362.1 V-type ATP synthase subunit E [Clostridium lacusfryxellense]
MSNLEKLAAKIIEDAKIKAEVILKEAKNNENILIENKTKEAEGLKSQMMEKTKVEAIMVSKRIISNSQLKARNEKLVAMQNMIDKVFEIALEKLTSMSDNEYLELLKNYLLSMPIAGNEEIILPGKYKGIVSNEYLYEINLSLKTNGKLGELKLSSDERDIKSGFVVFKNGIEINNTFESLVNSLRDELEPEIVNVLFK